MANLIGHYNRLISKNPIENLRERGYTEDQIRLFEENNKVFGTSTIHSVGLEIVGDLSKFEYRSFNFLHTTFRQYDNHGTLPYPGSLGDQPAAIIEAFQVMETLKFEVEEKMRKEHEQKQRQELRKRG